MTDFLEKSRSLPAEEAEAYLITMERLRRFHETRKGIPMANVREWMLASLIQSAPTARTTSGGRIHPDSSWFDLVADRRCRWVTGGVEAL